MNREESAHALKLILEAEVSPAQIGAFMMAHRIRRPEPQELAGMIDTYLELGPTLRTKSGQRRPICFGMPFDGRKRTAPIYPLTTLILISAGQPVVLQGGQRMPVKFGVSTVELFGALGLNLEGLTLTQLQTGFEQNGLALIHQPDHFPLADNLINYRNEIGKRPPLASMELIWTAHKGEHLLISGFVHPPTEARAWKALEIIGEKNLITIKGLEGSIDLATSRACITGLIKNLECERLILHPNKHGCSGVDMAWNNLQEWQDEALKALENSGSFKTALRWNAGIYLWFAGITQTISEGIDKAEESISSGSMRNTLQQLINWRSNI